MVSKGFWNVLEKCGLAETATDDHPVKEEMPKPAPTQTQQTTVAPQIKTQPAVTNGGSFADSEKAAKLINTAKQTLARALETAPTPIVDAWGNTLEPLEAAIPDEGARYRAALGIIKRTHSLETLLSDFDNCIGVTEETSRQFESTLEGQLDSKVGSKIRAVEILGEQITTTETQLQELSAKLLDLKKQKEEAQAGITAEKNQLELTKSCFESAYQEVKNGLKEQRQKIVQYGGLS